MERTSPPPRRFSFKPLYYADRLHVVNPEGYVGVITLWSKVDFVIKKFKSAGINLHPRTSPIAVFGNLYGNGLRELLRNLLYNPQINFLLICGRNRSGSLEELVNFFSKGVEILDSDTISYRIDASLSSSSSEETQIYPVRVIGTKRIVDNLVTPEVFQIPPRLFCLGELRAKGEIERLGSIFENEIEPHSPSSDYKAPFLWSGSQIRRIKIPLPEIDFDYYPSNPRGHTIIRENPVEAWEEILFRLFRFGHPVRLAKGERIELQNVKVIVEHPHEAELDADFENFHVLDKYNFDPSYLKQYQKDILSGTIEADETYNYGHRLRSYFGLDGLQACVERLKKDPQDRKSYVTCWDMRRDLESKHGHPCLVSIFLRYFDEKLTLTASFRTHNALDAWLVNFYGLMAIQKYVAEKVGIDGGPITVLSHSLTIDRRELARAEKIALQKKYRIYEDPNGYFRITLGKDKIFVEHCFEDSVLKTYSGTKASKLQHEIARDEAVSDINHAIYLGRQLERAEICLRTGEEFTQE